MANWNDPQPTRTGFGTSPSIDGKSQELAGENARLRKLMPFLKE